MDTVVRAFSVLTVTKASESSEGRIIEGTATTPSTDRVGDIVEPLGAQFTLPLPLLLHHDSTQPIGHVLDAKVKKDGIFIKARIAKSDEPGTLKDRLDEAWQSVKIGLIRGLSIGFKPIEVADIEGTWGQRFIKWAWLELSTVVVPANADATIATVKALDIASLPASGEAKRSVAAPGVTGKLLLARKGATPMTITEQIAAFEAKRAASSARMNEIQTKAVDEGRGKDEKEREEFDTLKGEVDAIDRELIDLRDLAEANKRMVKAVDPTPTPMAAAVSRSEQPFITVTENRPKEMGFVRLAMCKMQAHMDHRYLGDVVKERYPHDQELLQFVKAVVPGGTSTQTVWAGPLVYANNLASAFLEFLRPQTIIGKLNLNMVPFNIRYTSQTNGGNGYWVGEGESKPLTSFAFAANTLAYKKVAAISVITQELARFSSPSAEQLVRNALAAALIERIDITLVDPAHAVTSASPASLTNGVTPLSSAGTSADNVRTDLGVLLNQFLSNNQNPANLVLIMPNTLAMALSLMVNALGNSEFPDLTVNGGTLRGIPVVTSQYAANSSGGGNLVIAVNQNEVFLADDGQVTVDASTEASLQMSDAPTGNSATGAGVSVTSMFQTNSIALRAERFINWQKARTTAVAYMDDVNWGSIGSPA